MASIIESVKEQIERTFQEVNRVIWLAKNFVPFM
jgi:hypothetical protein